MADRQDIDALLVSALYGELTPADEARLKAHLESHPADRTALDHLTQTRDTVRESRILTVQLDPPQAVSALLLQEAHRRAPKAATAKEPEREGWFARFVRTFAAHPAMAAAAMLVIVLGITGTLYLRGDRSQFVERVAPAAEQADREAAEGHGASPQDEAVLLQRNAGSAYQATLAEDNLEKAPEPAAAAPVAPKRDAAKLEAQEQTKERAKDAKGNPDTYLSVETTTARPKPMELDDDDSRRRQESEKAATRRPTVTGTATDGGEETTNNGIVAGDSVGTGAGGATRSDPTTTVPGGSRSGPTAAPPPPPAPAPRVAEDQSRVVEDLATARALHGKLAEAVRTNNCAEAGRLAVTLSLRAPAYYGENVETDRALKPCLSTMTAARENAARARQTEQKRPAADAKPADTATNKR